MKSAQQAAQNWIGSAGRATTSYSEGVAAYNGDWAGNTTRQQALMLAGVNEAVSSGRWAARINAVGTQGWKSATEAKKANFGVGFNAGQGNYAAAAQKVITALSQGVSSLPPRGDINQNLQRSNALALYMHSLKGQLGAH